MQGRTPPVMRPLSVQQQIASSKIRRQIDAGNNAGYPGDVHSMKDSRSVFRPTVPRQGGLIGARLGGALSRLLGGNR